VFGMCLKCWIGGSEEISVGGLGWVWDSEKAFGLGFFSFARC
jgi:hypothetical protein